MKMYKFNIDNGQVGTVGFQLLLDEILPGIAVQAFATAGCDYQIVKAGAKFRINTSSPVLTDGITDPHQLRAVGDYRHYDHISDR